MQPEELTEEERAAVLTIEKHLFTAPYKLMISDYKARKEARDINPAEMLAIMSIAPGMPGGLAVNRFDKPGAGPYACDDFAGYIKTAALNAAVEPVKGNMLQRQAIKLANRSARVAVKSAFKMFGPTLSEAAEQVAKGLKRGQNVQFRPNPKTKKTDVFLFYYREEVEKIETEEFIIENFGRSGIKQLSKLLGGSIPG